MPSPLVEVNMTHDTRTGPSSCGYSYTDITVSGLGRSEKKSLPPLAITVRGEVLRNHWQTSSCWDTNAQYGPPQCFGYQIQLRNWLMSS